MHQLPEDDPHLHRALALASNAVGLASPNPTVGCVLARGDEVLGEGTHLYDNYDHAEIAALKQAASHGHNVQGATAYVTLEPCSHHGRTGPCSDALIAAGIARCVVATVDPNPKVRGSGIAKMRTANITVDIADPTSPLAQQARQLNDAFAFSIQQGRPFITLKAALSVDGKLAPPPSQRTSAEPFWLTGEPARADVQHLRHSADAILTGIGTILADDPLLSDRTGLPRRSPFLRIVLDSHLRTPLDSRLVLSAAKDVLLLCNEAAPADRLLALRERGVDVIPIPAKDSRLDIATFIAALDTRRLLSILIEAGPSINGTFLAAGLVDKLILYYSETELGTDALPFAEGVASPYILQQQLQRPTRRTFPHNNAEDVRISGYLHDPWSSIAAG
jgi:diaminohydroxyphosphoribosylaminopyrimidine deaminase/5-amino-6-(5-phosphoribosylamino)uracil reductase